MKSKRQRSKKFFIFVMATLCTLMLGSVSASYTRWPKHIIFNQLARITQSKVNIETSHNIHFSAGSLNLGAWVLSFESIDLCESNPGFFSHQSQRFQYLNLKGLRLQKRSGEAVSKNQTPASRVKQWVAKAVGYGVRHWCSFKCETLVIDNLEISTEAMSLRFPKIESKHLCLDSRRLYLGEITLGSSSVRCIQLSSEPFVDGQKKKNQDFNARLGGQLNNLLTPMQRMTPQQYLLYLRAEAQKYVNPLKHLQWTLQRSELAVEYYIGANTKPQQRFQLAWDMLNFRHTDCQFSRLSADWHSEGFSCQFRINGKFSMDLSENWKLQASADLPSYWFSLEENSGYATHARFQLDYQSGMEPILNVRTHLYPIDRNGGTDLPSQCFFPKEKGAPYLRLKSSARFSADAVKLNFAVQYSKHQYCRGSWQWDYRPNLKVWMHELNIHARNFSFGLNYFLASKGLKGLVRLDGDLFGRQTYTLAQRSVAHYELAGDIIVNDLHLQWLQTLPTLFIGLSVDEKIVVNGQEKVDPIFVLPQWVQNVQLNPLTIQAAPGLKVNFFGIPLPLSGQISLQGPLDTFHLEANGKIYVTQPTALGTFQIPTQNFLWYSFASYLQKISLFQGELQFVKELKNPQYQLHLKYQKDFQASEESIREVLLRGSMRQPELYYKQVGSQEFTNFPLKGGSKDFSPLLEALVSLSRGLLAGGVNELIARNVFTGFKDSLEKFLRQALPSWAKLQGIDLSFEDPGETLWIMQGASLPISLKSTIEFLSGLLFLQLRLAFETLQNTGSGKALEVSVNVFAPLSDAVQLTGTYRFIRPDTLQVAEAAVQFSF